jgi:hypothetical protein
MPGQPASLDAAGAGRCYWLRLPGGSTMQETLSNSTLISAAAAAPAASSSSLAARVGLDLSGGNL